MTLLRYLPKLPPISSRRWSLSTSATGKCCLFTSATPPRSGLAVYRTKSSLSAEGALSAIQLRRAPPSILATQPPSGVKSLPCWRATSPKHLYDVSLLISATLQRRGEGVRRKEEVFPFGGPLFSRHLREALPYILVTPPRRGLAVYKTQRVFPARRYFF